MIEVVAKERRKNVFGVRLRELRDARGLTQQALGERTGIAYQTIAKYERGDSIPNWVTVEKLADALGVPTDEFRKQE